MSTVIKIYDVNLVLNIIDPDPKVIEVVGTGPRGPMGPPGPAGQDAVWGMILGNIGDQADLQLALAGKQDDLGYTPENVTNKATSLAAPDDIKYPTTKAVNDQFVAVAAEFVDVYAAIADKYDASNPSGFISNIGGLADGDGSTITRSGAGTSVSPYIFAATFTEAMARIRSFMRC